MKKTIALAFLLFITSSYGQRLTNKVGDIKNLKDVGYFDVIFDYSNIEIPHYESEEAFLETKVLQREKKKKGSGEEFKTAWFSNRKTYYEPSFVNSFNKWFNPDIKAITVEDNVAEHIINVEIIFLFTGYNVVAANERAKVGAIISIYKKNEPLELVFSGKYEKILGNASYDEKDRISGSFSNLAKHTALYIIRKSK